MPENQGSATDDPMIAALLRERAGYVARGLDDRTAAVDEQLALRGHETENRTDPPAATDPPANPKTPAKNRQQTR